MNKHSVPHKQLKTYMRESDIQRIRELAEQEGLTSGVYMRTILLKHLATIKK